MAWDQRPDRRTRRALLHLSYSSAPPFGPVMLVTQDPTRTFDCVPTNLVHLSSYGGHGAGFLLVGMRVAPLSLPASPCAGLASIPKASFPDASEAIKGLRVCTTVPQSSCLSLRKNRCV